jgi:hypothetical protein
MSIDILGADWRFFWTENLHFYAGTPTAWDPSLNTGLGTSSLSTMWITSYLNVTALLGSVGFSWAAIGIFCWLLPIILIAFFSSSILFGYLFPQHKKFLFLAGLIYLINTYFLSLIGGGQLGVAFGYAFFPLVILSAIRLLRNPILSNSILVGLISSFQILFDPRLFYISIVTIIFLSPFIIDSLRISRKNLFFIVIVPILLIFLVHCYWIVPLLFSQKTALPQQISTIDSFKFFSFADFSHALSFLHPNWPENIFGKVYFLQPQFLLIPIFAIAGFLFKKEIYMKKHYGFVLLLFLGVFLAKGTNDPFGTINESLFRNVPGMTLFRDSTKFYMLIALSYAFLIPITISKIVILIERKAGRILSRTIIKIFIIFWILLPFSTFYLGDPLQQFYPHEIPHKYVQFKEFISSQHAFFRTYWIPQWQKYGYFSDLNPALGKNEFSQDNKKSNESAEKYYIPSKEILSLTSTKYIVLSKDMFLSGRDTREGTISYEIYRKKLDNISWLKRVRRFDDMLVYELPKFKSQIWSPSKNVSSQIISSNQTSYKLLVRNVKRGDILVFSEKYDPNWSLRYDNKILSSVKYEGMVNSFIFPEKGDRSVRIEYVTQRFVIMGIVASNVTVFLSLLYLILQPPFFRTNVSLSPGVKKRKSNTA